MQKSETYLCLLALLLSGCDDQATLRWELRFSSDTDRQATDVIETDILEGGCSGVPRGAPVRLYSDEPSEVPGHLLEPMRYGFQARAFDSACTLIAEGCEAANLPGPEHVVTLLTSVEDGPGCPPERCSRGVCSEDLPDGGPDDADIDAPDADFDAPDADSDDPDSDIDEEADAETDADPDDAADADPEPELLTCTYQSTDYARPAQTLRCRNVDGNPECYTASWPPCPDVLKPEYSIPDLPPRVDIVSATLRYDCEDCDHPGEEGVVRVNGAAYDMPAAAGWSDVWRNDITIDVTANIDGGNNVVRFLPGDMDCVYYEIRRVELIVDAWLLRCP